MNEISLESVRDNLCIIINDNNVASLDSYIKLNNVNIKNLNDVNFDLLIYYIENKISMELIKYIIYQCEYETFNYFVHENNLYKVPLFCVIANNNFKLADYLLSDNKADINFNDKTIILNLWNTKKLNEKNLKYILNHNYEMNSKNSKLINYFISDFNTSFIDIIFKHLVFDNKFIIRLLHDYKNYKNKKFTNEQLQNIRIYISELVLKEKNKIVINEDMYNKAYTTGNDYALKSLFYHDGAEFNIIIDRIKKYNLLFKAVQMNDYHFVQNVLSYKIFNLNTDYFKYLKEASNNNNKYIIELLIKALLNEFSKKKSNGQIASKEYDRQYLNLILNKVIEKKDINLMKNIFRSEELKSNIDVNISDTKGEYPIIKTLYVGAKELYEYLLEQGANIGTRDKYGNSLLSLALKDNLSLFNYLLKRREIDINCKDNNGDNLLLTAIKKKDFENVKLIVRYGNENNIDMSISDSNNNTPLLLSYKLNLKNIYNFLLEEINDVHVNQKDSSGNSIIYYTVCNNDIDNTKKLIDIGADINFKDQFNNCLLEISIINNFKDILKLLFENSNNIELSNSNDSGRTPLISLIESEKFSEKEKLDLINTILKKGAVDLNSTGCNGKVPLVYAVQMKSLSIVKLLIEYGANPNFGIKSNNQNLLIYAIDFDAFDILQYLINECHVNINFKDPNSIYLIRKALLCGNKNISDYILQYLIKYYGKNTLSEIFLDTFAISYSLDISEILEILKILIDNGLNINEKDHNDDTFLDRAIKSNNKQMIKSLLSNGAYTYKISNGQKILREIFTSNAIDLLKILFERGLDINITFENGDSLLDVAILYEKEAILQYLFEIGTDIRSIHNILEKVYFIISKDNANILNILINNHLNIYKKDKNGDSILLYAYKFSHNNIIKYFEHQKPDFSDLTNNKQVIKNLIEHEKTSSLIYLIKNNIITNAKDELGDTILDYVIKEFNNQIIGLFIENRLISYNFLNIMKIYSVIVEKNQIWFINYLIKTKFDINTMDDKGHTLMYYALICYQTDIIKYLYKHGAFIKISNYEIKDILDMIDKNPKFINILMECDYDINSIIQDAFESRRINVIQNLIKKGANANNIKHKDFMSLIRERNFDLLSILVNGGYNVNFWDDESTHSPLTLSVENNDSKIVNLLLKNNANIENINNRMSLVTNLIENGNYQMLSILIENNLNLESKDYDNNTPLVNAIQRGRCKMAQFLIKQGADTNYKRTFMKKYNEKNYKLNRYGYKNYKKIERLLVSKK